MPSLHNLGAIAGIREAADRVKVAKRAVYRPAAAKKISAFKVYGSWRFSRADIVKRIAAKTAAPLAAVLDPKRPVGRTR